MNDHQLAARSLDRKDFDCDAGGVIAEEHPTYSPVILPTGFHSTTWETYGGGPGTVGLHGWPTPDVLGKPSSAGCIRIPADALHVLATAVPIGTPVLIT